MYPEDYIKILHKLVFIAEEYKSTTVRGNKATEPGYFAVLMYVKWAPPELQKAAELEFVKMVEALGGYYSPGMASCGLIAYCMRDLKFELVREAAIKVKNAPEYAGRERISFRLALGRLIEVYEPVWRGAHLEYEYYRKKFPNPEKAYIKYWWQQICRKNRKKRSRQNEAINARDIPK